MPSPTGVVQEAGVPPRPSISTRQSRQEPKASTMSVAQSFGISMPGLHGGAHDRRAFRNGDLAPSMVSVTCFSATLEAGVP
jgi:hypothetical protein